MPVSRSIQGQIVHFATYVYPVSSASHHILITSQVAKAQLTKIRQTVNINPFFAFVAVHSLRPSHPSGLFFVRSVYWIPALHIDGKEVAKGRWDEQTVTEALNAWQKTLDGTPEDSSKMQS